MIMFMFAAIGFSVGVLFGLLMAALLIAATDERRPEMDDLKTWEPESGDPKKDPG